MTDDEENKVGEEPRRFRPENFHLRRCPGFDVSVRRRQEFPNGVERPWRIRSFEIANCTVAGEDGHIVSYRRRHPFSRQARTAGTEHHPGYSNLNFVSWLSGPRPPIAISSGERAVAISEFGELTKCKLRGAL